MGKGKLLDSFDIEFVGIEKGNQADYGGVSGLNNFKRVYESNSSLFHRRILLLYDCDAQKPDEQVDRLWVRSIPCNTENTEVTNGIENLFPVNLFEDGFYRKSRKSDGGHITTLDKGKFCNWVCEKRKNVDDFEKFDKIVEIIEEFIESQPSSVQ